MTFEQKDADQGNAVGGKAPETKGRWFVISSCWSRSGSVKNSTLLFLDQIKREKGVWWMPRQ